MSEWFSFLAGGLTGMLSGAGLGGGTLLMVYMTAVAGLPQHMAQGINLLYFLPCSAAALVSHVKNKLVDWKAVLPAVPAGLIASGICAFLAQSADGALLRKLFGVGVIFVGLREILHKPK